MKARASKLCPLGKYVLFPSIHARIICATSSEDSEPGADQRIQTYIDYKKDIQLSNPLCECCLKVRFGGLFLRINCSFCKDFLTSDHNFGPGKPEYQSRGNNADGSRRRVGPRHRGRISYPLNEISIVTERTVLPTRDRQATFCESQNQYSLRPL